MKSQDDDRYRDQSKHPMTLQGKVVAVTGAFGTLGAAMVTALLQAGARVAAIDREPRPKHGVELGAAQLHGGVDLGESGAARQTFERIAQAMGRLDALVNIAGAFRWETLAAGSLDTWDVLYRINLRTAAAASQAALPHLLATGHGARIVNVGAAAATKAAAGMGAYAASKAGVAKLTEALAEELKHQGVTVNAVLPGIIDTPANRSDMPGAEHERWVNPQDLAGVIVFLLSPAAQSINGALIPVTGRL